MRRKLVVGITTAGLALASAGAVAGHVAGRSYAVFLAPMSSASPGKGDYTGSARSLVLTAREAKYSAIASSRPTTPSAGKRLGLRSAWETKYRDPDGAGTDVLIYVYDSIAHTERAFSSACPGCARKVVKGVRIRYTSRKFNGVPTVAAAGVCRNLYIGAVSVAVTETPNQLAIDAGYEIGSVVGKAIGRGMATCS